MTALQALAGLGLFAGLLGVFLIGDLIRIVVHVFRDGKDEP